MLGGRRWSCVSDSWNHNIYVFLSLPISLRWNFFFLVVRRNEWNCPVGLSGGWWKSFLRLLVDETINVCAVNSLGTWCMPDTVLNSRYIAVNRTKSSLPLCSLHSDRMGTEEQNKSTDIKWGLVPWRRAGKVGVEVLPSYFLPRSQGGPPWDDEWAMQVAGKRPFQTGARASPALLRSRGSWRVGGIARGPAWPEWAHSNERQRLGRQEWSGGGGERMGGSWRATVRPWGWKATRRGWSSGVMWPHFYLHRPHGLLVLRQRGRNREAIAVWLVTLEVAGPRLCPVLLSPLCTFVLPDPGGSHQFSQELV